MRLAPIALTLALPACAAAPASNNATAAETPDVATFYTIAVKCAAATQALADQLRATGQDDPRFQRGVDMSMGQVMAAAALNRIPVRQFDQDLKAAASDADVQGAIREELAGAHGPDQGMHKLCKALEPPH